MKKMLCLLGAVWTTGLAGAATTTFDFNDPKKVNNIIFQTDAPLESINGSANGITGQVLFDPQNPASVSGNIIVAASSLHVPNPLMKEHLHGKDWMNVAQFPEIRFETGTVAKVQTKDNVTTAEITGKMTIRGVTKTMTVPVTLTYLKDKLRARGGINKDGDILVLRASFGIKRSDFGINSGKFEEKVSDDVLLKFSLAGLAPRP
jgi:polyisoprenoid-binding protein YceI